MLGLPLLYLACALAGVISVSRGGPDSIGGGFVELLLLQFYAPVYLGLVSISAVWGSRLRHSARITASSVIAGSVVVLIAAIPRIQRQWQDYRHRNWIESQIAQMQARWSPAGLPLAVRPFIGSKVGDWAEFLHQKGSTSRKIHWELMSIQKDQLTVNVTSIGKSAKSQSFSRTAHVSYPELIQLMQLDWPVERIWADDTVPQQGQTVERRAFRGPLQIVSLLDDRQSSEDLRDIVHLRVLFCSEVTALPLVSMIYQTAITTNQETVTLTGFGNASGPIWTTCK